MGLGMPAPVLRMAQSAWLRTVKIVHRRPRKAILTFGLLAATAVVGGVSAGWLRPARTAPEGFYAQRLSACGELSGEGAAGGAIDPVVCFTGTMELAITAGDLDVLLADLALVVEDQDLYLLCHPAAHQASKAALEHSDDLFDLLDTAAGTTVCDWGFGHGVIDTLALRGYEDDTLDELLSWCFDRRDDQRLYGLCADAIGHYIWTTTADVPGSVRTCERTGTEHGKLSCAGGVLMQMFEPAEQQGGTFPRREAPERIPTLCRDWVKATADEPTRNGCSHGAGYVYGLDVRDAVWPWLNSSQANQTSMVPEPTMGQILASIERAVTHCRSLPTAASPCIAMIFRSIPLPLAHRFPAQYDLLCETFADPHMTEPCKARKNDSYQ